MASVFDMLAYSNYFLWCAPKSYQLYLYFCVVTIYTDTS